MKKIIMTAALVLASLSPALASLHYETTYHDNIRPHDRPRSDAVYNAALDACYAQTGQPREARDSEAFKDCMQTHSYSWVSTKLAQNPPSWQLASRIPKGHFIDPDTGLLCYNSGGGTICETPPDNMTIRYTSKRGLNCTRTGIVGICSSF